MLYVFHVDTGRMIKFDMNVALSSVQNLKDMIERLHGLPAANVVLLVSGGEMLTPGSLVCSYSAGTDTNPIYMFSTVAVKPQPWPSIEPGNNDLSEQVDRCLALPATYSTVVTRAQLAQQIYDMAREEETICERLVHEQHLQQQGWSAVIANMEDLTDEFRQRFQNFSKSFVDHLCKRNEYTELLGEFNNDLDKLSRIPILPGLMQNAEEDFRGFDDYLNNDEVFSRSQQNTSVIDVHKTKSLNTVLTNSGETSKQYKEDEPKESSESTGDNQLVVASNEQQETKFQSITLLQWISAKQNHDTLKIMAEECSQGLATFNEEKFEKLKQEVLNIIRIAGQEEIKEIKGLEDRLFGLEKLMYELKKSVQEQKELSTAFQQNQNRASNLGDASILPDLCASHRSQLVVMLQNHKVIRDIHRRVSRAKDELGANLEKRLKYIVQIENTMSELDNNLLFYHRCLRRVERHLSIIKQIHQSPSIYVAAVTEVVRRRIFSNEFITWASNLACDFYTIHNEELLRRQEFNANFEGHFLNALFPGMNDMPPSFANETPILFDDGLPNITKSDLDTLSLYLPDIAAKIQFPDMGPVIDFFISRSGSKSIKSSGAINKSQQSTAPGLTYRAIDFHAHLKDGFESETDTEEFEKVGQSANEQQQHLNVQTAAVSTSTTENNPQLVSISTSMEPVAVQSVETLTEDNLGSTRLEVEGLKSILKNLSNISYKSIGLLKNDLKSLKEKAIEDKNQLKSTIEEFSNLWNKITDAYEVKENNLIEGLKYAHRVEIDDTKKQLSKKIEEYETVLNDKTTLLASQNEVILNLEKEKDSMKMEISKLSQEIHSLQEKLNVSINEKEKAVSECRERLIHDHKTELESLRCRFKLMTSVDKSPSDSSLEKIERPDMIEIVCHESILNQTREDLYNEKELAIKAAVELERSKWHANAYITGNDSQISPSVVANIDLLKQIVEEKDKQLDTMRERDAILSKENSQLKMKIESLTSGEESDKAWLKEKLEFLNKDKTRLEYELSMEKSRRIEMESSVATMKSSIISRDMGSPELSSSSGGARSKMSSSQFIAKQNITMESCNKGDVVFVVWSTRHRQYIVVQESPYLFFVHGDSLSALNLKLPIPGDNDLPTPHYCVGKVIDKEYCQARKDENRYRVAKGTKFYRVKLQPVIKVDTRLHHKRERFESTSSSISVSRSTSTQYLIDSFAQTDGMSPSQMVRDMVDSGVGVGPTAVTVTGPGALSTAKERTMSVCSVAEIEEEPISLLGERCHYTSLSEEDEKDCAASTVNVVTTSSTSTSTLMSTTSTNQQQTIIVPTTEISSSEKDQDDSDEYRSLEAKDESDFPTTV